MKNETKINKSEISTSAKVSPHCRKKQGGIFKWMIIALLALTMTGTLIGCGSDDKKVKDVTPTAKDDSAETKEDDSADKPEEKTEFAIGEVAEYDGVQVSVLSYEESAGNDWGAPAEGKIFVFANMEITNNTDKEISVSSMASFDAYCDDYKLDYSSSALMAASVDDRQQLDGSIAPGKKLNGWLGFEVPTEWKTIEINYKDNIWSDSNFKFIVNK